MNTAYFWKDGELVEWRGRLGISSIPLSLRNCWCVDVTDTEEYGRYGMYLRDPGQWRHRPLSEFPLEFRAALLLLGVT